MATKKFGTIESLKNVVLTTLFIIFSNSSKSSEAKMVPAVFVFGDSIVDVGNNNYLPFSISKANFPPNGIDFPHHNSTGRFSNGKVAADFIAEKVGLPSSPPYLSLSSENASAFMTGVNFASGKSRISNNNTLGQTISLPQQVKDYETVHKKLVEKKGNGEAQTFLSMSLFVVVIGNNDLFEYSDKSELQKQNSPQQFIDSLISALKKQIKRLYNLGARKFAFAGIATIGCVPAQRIKHDNRECNDEINGMAVKYNDGVISMFQQLNVELQGLSYSFLHTYSLFRNFIEKPSNYGFKEVKAACCGIGRLNADVPCLPISKYCSDRRNYVFWDPFHPTEAVSRIIVDTLFDGPSEHTYPMNVWQLLTA